MTDLPNALGQDICAIILCEFQLQINFVPEKFTVLKYGAMPLCMQIGAYNMNDTKCVS